MIIEMPVCQHAVPRKFKCSKCDEVPVRLAYNADALILQFDQKIINMKKEMTRNNKKNSLNLDEIYDKFRFYYKELEKLTKKIDEIEGLVKKLNSSEIVKLEKQLQVLVQNFINSSQEAERTVRKRDEVINSLCQKISALEAQINSQR